MIKINNVSKKYKSKRGICTALSDINLEIPSKGFVALTGENGCGKTTLLNLIATIDNDFDGEILIDNLDVKKNKEIIRSNIITYVFQENFFVHNLSVLDNLFLENETLETIDQKLKEFSIQEKINKFPDELSGGQKQRASLIRGLIRNSEILLVDEPTSSMDEEMELQTFKLLKEISKEKLVILVSHNKGLVSGFCDIIIKLSNGNLEYVRDNANVSNVRYEDNKVIFDNEININSIDKHKLSKMTEQYHEIVLQSNKNSKIEKIQDYSIKEHKINDNQYTLNNNSKKGFFKSTFKSSLLITILWILFISLQLVLTETMIDFYNFDDVSFAYNTLIQNNEQFTNVEYCNYYSYLYKDLEEETLIDLFEQNDRVDIVKRDSHDYDLGTLDLEYEIGLDYDSTVDSINYSNFKNCKLLIGNIPTTPTEYAITDYIADGLIKYNSNYSQYSDFLEKGIYVSDYYLKVVGILDTNYEDYHLVDDVRVSDLVGSNGQTFCAKMFNSIYINNNIRDCYESGLNYSATAGLHFDIVYQEGIGVEDCYINEAFSEQMLPYSGSKEIKTRMGYFNVKKTIDDDRINPTIYISKDLYDWNSTFAFMQYDSINLTISNKEIMKLIQDSNLRITSYSGTYITRLTSEIENLHEFFQFAYSLLFVFLFVLSILFIGKKMRSNKELFVTMRMNGLSDLKYNLFESASILSGVLLSIIFNIGLYYLCYALFNSYLLSAFDCSIYLFNNHINTFFITIGLLIGIFIIAYMICLFNRRRKSLIRIIK